METLMQIARRIPWAKGSDGLTTGQRRRIAARLAAANESAKRDAKRLDAESSTFKVRTFKVSQY